MEVAGSRTNPLTPDAGWAFLSLGGYFLGLVGVVLLHYDPDAPAQSNPPYWFPGLTISQIATVLLVAAATWAVTLSSLAAPRAQGPPKTQRAIRIISLFIVFVLFPVAFKYSYKDIWLALPLLLPMQTRGLLRLHAWLVSKGYVRFTPKAGSALFGSSGYGSSLTVTGPALRSEYEEKIRQAGAQEERNRLARDLHDSIKQQIFAIHTSAATAQVRLQGNGDGAREAIDQIRIAARDAMTELEVMLDQLRTEPLEPVGLAEALKKLCETTGFRIGATVECVLGDLPPVQRLRPKTAETVLRIAQEALANVSRHARASQVKVTLDSTTSFMLLTIEDNGAGFDSARLSSGMGIGNMRSRAAEVDGDLRITGGADGKGTTVTFSVLLTAGPNQWVWAVAFLGPMTIGALGILAQRFVDKNQHPTLSTTILWTVDIGIAVMLIPMLVFGHKEMQKRRKMAKRAKPS